MWGKTIDTFRRLCGNPAVAVAPTLLLTFAISSAGAQGMLAPVSSTGTTVSTSTLTTALLAGQRLPEGLTVTNLDHQTRTLISYKSPVEVLVVMFLSTTCPADRAYLGEYRRFYDKFKEWHVSYVAISTQPNEDPKDLAKMLDAAHLGGVNVVRDTTGEALKVLSPSGLPWLVVLDEVGRLSYRGPLQPQTHAVYTTPANKRVDIWQAMDDIIGHVNPVVNPEPPGTPACPLQ